VEDRKSNNLAWDFKGRGAGLADMGAKASLGPRNQLDEHER